MTREYTNKLLQFIDDGMLDPAMAIQMCLSYMSEDEVKDMCLSNDLFVDEDEIDESMDGDFDSAMTSCGWGTNEDYGCFGDE